MKREEVEALAKGAAKGIKTQEDLAEFRRMLTKVTVEAALNAELDAHLGYDKHQKSEAANSRNGSSKKQLITEDGPLELVVPRDRDSSFEPQLVKKHERRFRTMGDKILSLYAKGMTTREIQATFLEMYDAEVSPALISKVTDAVIDDIIEWQSRPLESHLPHRLSRWHRRQDSPGQTGHQQIHLPGIGSKPVRTKRTAGHVVC